MGTRSAIMPIIALFVKASVDGLAKWAPLEDHHWCVDLKNTLGEEFRQEVMLSKPEEEEELEGSKGTCDFQLKWEGSKKASYLNFVEGNKDIKGEYTEDDSDTWVPLVAWDCKGLEPVVWHPQGNFTAEGTTGHVFEDIWQILMVSATTTMMQMCLS